jgi:hypothetical protein
MKIENQVCTLEQAVKFKELGIKQDSHFFWVDRKEKSKLVYAKSVEFLNSLPIFAAFLTAELSVLIGNKYTLSETTKHKEDCKRWICGDIIGVEDGDYDYNNCSFGSTEAECRGNMLIHLIENKLVDVEACNKRLVE